MVSSIWENFRHLFNDYVVEMAVAISLAIGLMFWASFKSWFKSLPKPLLPLFVIAVFGITFFSVNQYQQLRKQYGMNFARMSNEKIQNTLMQWLDKDGWSTKSQQNPNNLFQIRAEDSFKRDIIITRTKDKDNLIYIIGSWNVSQSSQTILANLSEQDRKEMISEIQIEVARFGLDWSGLKLPLKKFTLQTRLPCDETVTRELFMKQVVTIRNTFIIITVIVNRAVYRAEHIPD